MKRIDIVYKHLLELPDNQGIDAQNLAQLLCISRANVSHDLNLLCKEDKVYKSSGRPVLFFAKKHKTAIPRASKLETLLKYNISLKQPIEQGKAAILYPPKGMHCLLFGETGVGKSMFARVLYEYALEMKVKPNDSPFITFNCADYSHNPQLLTAHLFGVKKGTYTGADTDKVGLVEKANDGILFLDEVHRLPPEGQEALFTFLDTNKFHRIGDDEIRQASVLIICATTENPQSALLETFTRRIPMMITIPALKDRTLEERLYLVKSFFKHESIRVNQEIYVSLNTIRAFLSYNCSNNIGQLKSDIQLVCAKAYSEFLTNIKPDVRICSHSLPTHIKEGLCKEKEHRILWNKLVSEEIEFFKFHMEYDQNSELAENNGIYEIIERKLKSLKARGIADIDIENILEKDISRYFEKYISGISEEINKKNLLNILGNDVFDFIDKVIYNITLSLKKNLSPNIYTALALHINTLINRVANNKAIINPHLKKIKETYPEEYKIARQAKLQIEEYLKHLIPEDEVGYLTLFLLPEENQPSNKVDKVIIILIAHGKFTASSMAEVANKLLGENYVLSIDSPLDINPAVILDRLKKLIKQNPSESGYLLLVDMGSLITFADIIEKEFKVPIRVFPLVSTLHVIEATRKALLGFSLNEIYQDVRSVNSYIYNNQITANTTEPQKKIAIVTSCLTGEGGSIAIEKFLEKNLRYDKELFEIYPFNCLDKNYFKEQLVKLQAEKEIIFVVSPFPIDLAITQYTLYDVLSMKAISLLQQAIDNRTALLKMNIILKENVDNLDGEELYNDILMLVNRIGTKLSITIGDDALIGLVLHLGCMISRLKKGETSVEYPDKEEFISKHSIIHNVVKENLIFLYNKYFIETSQDEICYITNFFLHQDNSAQTHFALSI